MRVFLRTAERSMLWTARPGGACFAAVREPGALLRRSVVQITAGSERLEAPLVEDIVPDAAVHLIVELGDAPRAVVVGATSRPTRLELSGTIEHVGVQLRAGGTVALLGVPASELAERSTPLEALWGAPARELLEQLGALRDPAARAARLEAALATRLARAAWPFEPRAERVVRLVRAAGGQIRVSALSARLELTPRRVEQLLRAELGLAPRTLARLVRLHAAADRLAACPARPLAELALDCGFADQAHMTRDFRALAGITPGALRDFAFVQDLTPAAG